MAKDLLAQAIATIPPLDEDARRAAHAHWDGLVKPEGSLGRFEGLAEQLAAIRGTPKPAFHHKAVVVFAADHGVIEEGVSSYTRGATAAMVENFFKGGEAVCVLGRFLRAEVHLVDVGVDAPPFSPRQGFFPRRVARGTRNFAHEPAMTPSQAREAVRVGLEVTLSLITSGADLIAVGDLGAGSTTSAAAMLAVMTGLPVEQLVGRGQGISDETLRRKNLVISSALERHLPRREDPWEVMQCVGGLEIAAMAGSYLACASRRVPVVVDGFIGTTAALWATQLAPALRPYLIPSHATREPGHALALEAIGLVPFFDFSMRQGEGTGAALMIGLCDLSARLLREVDAYDIGATLASDLRRASVAPVTPKTSPVPPAPSPAARVPARAR